MHHWERIHNEMMDTMNQCKNLELPETEKIECCFRIATNYWEIVKRKWKEKENPSLDEEINFFRDLKPGFTAYIEFYLLQNQGLLFAPDWPAAKFSYWKNEANRYYRFCRRNMRFLFYFHSGSRKKDGEYFICRNESFPVSPSDKIFNDCDCRSSHDGIVRSFIANKMYREFATTKLSGCQASDPIGGIEDKSPGTNGLSNLTFHPDD